MTTAASEALRPAAALRGTVVVPSDKSISHRALICAALAHGQSRITLRYPGEDVLSTLGALNSLGASLDATRDADTVVVTVRGAGTREQIAQLGSGTADCGNSGTSMRLLSGVAASGSGVATLVGDESLSRRPMARVTGPLRQMGADISLMNDRAPIVVRGRRPLRALDHVLPVASAQVLAAISLAGLVANGTTMIRVPGQVRDHTERLLTFVGADVDRVVDRGGTTTTIRGPSSVHSFELNAPGDFSSASAWLVAGALHADAHVRIEGVGLNPTRTALIDVLRAMDANIEATVNEDRAGEPVGDIVVRGGRTLRAISLGEDQVAPLIDELPLLAVAMAAADGTSEVNGAQELRVKESDRISAIGAALTAAGANFEELPDGWRISRGTPRAARITTFGDHRIAMALAIAAWTGVASSVQLDDADCVAVSYPSFWTDARSIGALA
jgi:3-phosphoshikimate 1-carboxyvinyltransferase